MNATLFDQGIRVALFKLPSHLKPAPGMSGFAVGMDGGRYAVPLPAGYDGRTSVHWVDGWIVVQHPDQPPILADTTTGTTSPMNEHALAAAMRAFEAPRLTAAR